MVKLGFVSGLLEGLKTVREANLEAERIRVQKTALEQQSNEEALKAHVEVLRDLLKASRDDSFVSALGGTPPGEGGALSQVLSGLPGSMSQIADGVLDSLEDLSARTPASPGISSSISPSFSNPAKTAKTQGTELSSRAPSSTTPGGDSAGTPTLGGSEFLSSPPGVTILPPPQDLVGKALGYYPSPQGDTIVVRTPQEAESLRALENQKRQAILSQKGIPGRPRTFISQDEFIANQSKVSQDINKIHQSQFEGGLTERLAAVNEVPKLNRIAESFIAEKPTIFLRDFRVGIAQEEVKIGQLSSGVEGEEKTTPINRVTFQLIDKPTDPEDFVQIGDFVNAIAERSDGLLDKRHALILRDAVEVPFKQWLKKQEFIDDVQGTLVVNPFRSISGGEVEATQSIANTLYKISQSSSEPLGLTLVASPDDPHFLSATFDLAMSDLAPDNAKVVSDPESSVYALMKLDAMERTTGQEIASRQSILDLDARAGGVLGLTDVFQNILDRYLGGMTRKEASELDKKRIPASYGQTRRFSSVLEGLGIPLSKRGQVFRKSINELLGESLPPFGT